MNWNTGSNTGSSFEKKAELHNDPWADGLQIGPIPVLTPRSPNGSTVYATARETQLESASPRRFAFLPRSLATPLASSSSVARREDGKAVGPA
jgi:hypothetical protein